MLLYVTSVYLYNNPEHRQHIYYALFFYQQGMALPNAVNTPCSVSPTSTALADCSVFSQSSAPSSTLLPPCFCHLSNPSNRLKLLES